MSDDKPREFWLWNKNKAITLEESVYRFPNPNKEHIHVIEYSAYEKLEAERDALLAQCESMAKVLDGCNAVAYSYDMHPKGFSVIFDDTKQALEQYRKFKDERGAK